MTTLSSESLEILLRGVTHTLDHQSGPAHVYFSLENTCHMLLANGQTRSGRWRIEADHYVAEWNTGDVGRWRLEKGDHGIEYVNLDRPLRVKLTGVTFENSKNLPAEQMSHTG